MPRTQKLDLTEVNKAIAQFIKERDWTQFHSPKNLSMSIAIEAAELMEHFQWANSDAEALRVMKDSEKRRAIEEEIADIAIYLLDFCQLNQMDLKQVIAHKLEKNKKQYPAALVKGKSNKYTTYQSESHEYL